MITEKRKAQSSATKRYTDRRSALFGGRGVLKLKTMFENTIEVLPIEEEKALLIADNIISGKRFLARKVVGVVDIMKKKIYMRKDCFFTDYNFPRWLDSFELHPNPYRWLEDIKMVF